VPDLITWTMDLCKDNKVVPKHIAMRILTKHIDDEGSFGYGYGIGMCQHQDPHLNHWRHTGLVYGYESVLAYYNNLDIILVNLSNCCNDFYARSKITRPIRKELSHITDEAEQDKLVEKILDERYPDRLAMMDRIYPKPVRHFENFLKGE
jgi:CubicO group peptidase (beta-lactamase class C family)